MSTETTPPPRYRWDHVHAWFDHYLEADRDREELANLCRQLAEKLDSDQLQDLFQGEMDDDGYFTDLNKRAFQCGGCDQWHPLGWTGDCRDNDHRFPDLPDGWEEVEEDTPL